MKVIPDLEKLLDECLEEYWDLVLDDFEELHPYEVGVPEMIEGFKEENKYVVYNHLYYDFYDLALGIKAVPQNELYDLYEKNAGQDEFDRNAMLEALNTLLLDDYIKRHKNFFKEKEREFNEIYAQNKDIKSRSKLNYESIRRNRRRNTYR